MKILSFDVGIKNLAYCLIEKKEDDFEIKKWDIINLVDDRDVCEHVLKRGGRCGKIARFFMKDSDDKITTYCKEHNDKNIIKLNESCFFVCQHTKCIERSKYNILGKPEWSWCEKHNKDAKKILTKFKSRKLTKQNCTQQSLQELADKLFTRLDKESDFLQVDDVLIENQPSLKNPTMKTIASMLYSYFVMRGIVDRENTKSTIKNIKFISPSNKLKIDKATTKKSLDEAKDKKEVYDITKGLGKIYCTTLISKMENGLLEKHSKKDDLCDSFLQGFQYLFNPIPQRYVDKIKSIDREKLTTKNIKSKKNTKVK